MIAVEKVLKGFLELTAIGLGMFGTFYFLGEMWFRIKGM